MSKVWHASHAVIAERAHASAEERAAVATAFRSANASELRQRLATSLAPYTPPAPPRLDVNQELVRAPSPTAAASATAFAEWQCVDTRILATGLASAVERVVQDNAGLFAGVGAIPALQQLIATAIAQSIATTNHWVQVRAARTVLRDIMTEARTDSGAPPKISVAANRIIQRELMEVARAPPSTHPLASLVVALEVPHKSVTAALRTYADGMQELHAVLTRRPPLATIEELNIPREVHACIDAALPQDMKGSVVNIVTTFAQEGVNVACALYAHDAYRAGVGAWSDAAPMWPLFVPIQTAPYTSAADVPPIETGASTAAAWAASDMVQWIGVARATRALSHGKTGKATAAELEEAKMKAIQTAFNITDPAAYAAGMSPALVGVARHAYNLARMIASLALRRVTQQPRSDTCTHSADAAAKAATAVNTAVAAVAATDGAAKELAPAVAAAATFESVQEWLALAQRDVAAYHTALPYLALLMERQVPTATPQYGVPRDGEAAALAFWGVTLTDADVFVAALRPLTHLLQPAVTPHAGTRETLRYNLQALLATPNVVAMFKGARATAALQALRDAIA